MEYDAPIHTWTIDFSYRQPFFWTNIRWPANRSNAKAIVYIKQLCTHTHHIHMQGEGKKEEFLCDIYFFCRLILRRVYVLKCNQIKYHLSCFHAVFPPPRVIFGFFFLCCLWSMCQQYDCQFLWPQGKWYLYANYESASHLMYHWGRRVASGSSSSMNHW